MTDTSFIGKIAETLIHDYKDELTETIVVLPSKRARIYLIDALRKQIASPTFSPQILSIEDFVEDLAGLRQIDPVEILFEFYQVYVTKCKDTEPQSFEIFANWGKTLLQDFNEIDRYLIDPNRILRYLDDIEEIKHWSVTTDPRSELVQKHLDFWKRLPEYYSSLYNHLLQKKKGYQGMIYREALNRLKENNSQYRGKNLIFAGFNALNAVEELIFRELQVNADVKIYWDIDESFLSDSDHDAGLFIRQYKKNWSFYKTNPFEWISNEFNQKKRINIIGTPKSIGQARIVGNIVEKLESQSSQNDLSRTAIVLADESLLLPVLYSLPDSVDKLNITMGYSSRNNPAQILVNKLFKLHVSAIKRKGNYTFYHKELLDVLTHPLISSYVNAGPLVEIIKKNNYSFISNSKLFELQKNRCELFHLLFDKWEGEVLISLNRIVAIIQVIKGKISSDNEEEKIAKAFLFSIYKVINKLINYASQYSHVSTVEIAYSIYKQIVDLAEVSFEGEPLSGLQVMGVLESRVLDFENVIITSMNEGKFPAGKSSNSFIPYDVKREYGLPTYKEKDAIYTYHFYHLLQRAKNVFLLYNTESEGFDAGEKSRFITQIEIENRPNHSISHEIFNAAMPKVTSKLRSIYKSDLVLNRLHEIAESSFSPSALTSYIRNPFAFYLERILRVREIEEVEETIAANTLGTIIHESLRSFYKPYEGKILTKSVLQGFLNLIEEEVRNQFKLIYREGEINKGRNLLAFEVAKRHLQNFIKKEIQAVDDGDVIRILAIETTFQRWLSDPKLPCPVLIKGNVDRIEERNGIVRVIDYKTGKVERRNMVLKTWDGLTKELKNDKIIQVLAYSYMFMEDSTISQMEAGIISFKNLSAGFLPFIFKSENNENSIITKEVLQYFTNEIVVLLQEIFDPTIPFEEKL